MLECGVGDVGYGCEDDWYVEVDWFDVKWVGGSGGESYVVFIFLDLELGGML